ncbi:MAG: tRNA (guanosine(37)-N1)-methyltransferase TrmD [Acutalibacteraceae bacterium]|nr:tRNA (guanosine(37)-N1)-methyltransferase TrmD [Acutalibacteraceae bacterium]
MRIDIMTIFPEMMEHYLSESIIGRARAAQKVEINCVNIRDYTTDKHNKTDDEPYGGGKGMVMLAQPIDDCFSAICEQTGTRPHFIYMSPQGKTLTQKRAAELAKMDNIVILCGHYEGVDQRVLDKLCDEEISIGDYVLTGGELPALVLCDCICRMVDGVLSDSVCFTEESHFNGLLEYPQYTRPAVWQGREVPAVLQSGHHKNIEQWKHDMSVEITRKKRPEMLKNIDE